MYCTPSDLVTRFGADELVQLTNRSGLRVPDEAFAQLVAGGDMDAWDEDVQAAAEQMLVAVEEAIEDARAEIDPHLEARYKLPLSSIPRVIKRIAMEMARYILHGDAATEAVQRRQRDMLGLLRSIGRGETKLGLDPADEATRHQGGVATTGGPPVFTRDNLQGYTG